MKNNKKKEIREKQNKSNKILSNLTTQLLISLFLFLFIIFPSFAAPTSTDDCNLGQLEQYLNNSAYSDFQKRMVTKSAQEAMEKGISEEDTLSIIKGSIDNKVDPYNVKKFLDTTISAKDSGISEKPLINKVKEGLAKNVEERTIVNVLNQKAENLKSAQNLLAENQLSDSEREEMIDVLADSLANGVSPNTLARVLEIRNEESKDWSEVEEITKELANLGLKAAELGLGNTQIEAIFNQVLENGNSMDDICLSIQDLITAQAAVLVTSGSSSKDVAAGGTGSSATTGSDISTSPGSSIPGSGSTTPSGETGSSPISSGGSNKTDSESGSSPLK